MALNLPMFMNPEFDSGFQSDPHFENLVSYCTVSHQVSRVQVSTA